MKKILYLTLSKKWFDLIATGQKVVEYREGKPYWHRRFFKNNELVKFDEVHFSNGYRKDSPFMRVKFLDMALVDSFLLSPINGEELKPNAKYFIILLGEVLEIRNWREKTNNKQSIKKEEGYRIEFDPTEPISSGSPDEIVMPCLGCGKGVYVKRGSPEELGVFNVFCFGGECEDRYASRL